MFDSMSSTGKKSSSVANTHGLLARSTRAEMRKIVSQRLCEAREMNGLSQTDAALRFGYKTPAQLCQWEMNRRMPPTEKLVLACYVYRVSLDYLMGVSPEPDRDPQAAQTRHVLEASRQMMESLSREVAEAVIAQTKLGGPTVEASVVMVSEGERLVSAFKRFVELNPKAFENSMRGAATLASFMNSFEQNGLNVAKDMIERYKRVGPKAARITLDKRRVNDFRTLHLFDSEITDA